MKRIHRNNVLKCIKPEKPKSCDENDVQVIELIQWFQCLWNNQNPEFLYENFGNSHYDIWSRSSWSGLSIPPVVFLR